MTLTAPVAPRPSEWLAEPGLGVYVHIPFCLHRCHYCDFNTYEGLAELHEPYVDALIAHIHRLPRPERSASTVFFGGGTPTLLPPESLGRILGAVRDAVGLAPVAEVSVEVNPETVDEEVFTSLLAHGFNRVSIGTQSLVPRVLEQLGRTHSPERALESVRAARSAGFMNVNVDLIYGSPWETDADWTTSLRGVVDADPEHVSAYALTIEEGTPLGTMVRDGRMPDVDPDVQADRHAAAEAILGSAGLERYEISNWAKPGAACRHNLIYWSAGDYLGCGAGAHGHSSGRRYWSVRLPRDFIGRVAEGVSPEEGEELLLPETRVGEALMLGLRLTSGIHVSSFSRRFGVDLPGEHARLIDELVRAGRLERLDGWLRIPPDAAMVANEVLWRFL